jgi:hypothetical protein
VPSSPGAANVSRTPQKLNGTKDAQFFTVGNLGDRTFVIYMKKKNVRLLCLQSKRPLTRDTLQFDNVFRVLEPVIGKINERTEAQPTNRLGFGSRSEWFRVYRVGFTLLSPLLSQALDISVSGFLLVLGFVRLAIPESKDRNLVQQGFRNHGSLRVSCLSGTWNGDAFIDARVASRALPSLRRRTHD